MVRFGFDQFVAGLLVYAPGGEQKAVRPKCDLLVSGSTGKSGALIDQSLSDTQSARVRIDDKQSQPCDVIRFFDQKNRPDILAVLLRDPASFLFRIEILYVLRDDLRDKRFVILIPRVFLCVESSVALHDPTHVAGFGWTKNVGVRLLLLLVLRHHVLDQSHRGEKAFSLD